MKTSTNNLKNIAKELGSRGGKKRAEKYSKEQLSEWAKKGGRPKKNSPIDKPTAKL